MNLKRATLVVGAVVLLAGPLVAQDSSIKSDDTSTVVNFTLAPDNPDRQMTIDEVVAQYYGQAATSLLCVAPGTVRLDGGAWQLLAVGNGFLPASVAFYVQASGGTQDWEISTKPKLTHDIVFWGGIGTALLGVVVATIDLSSYNPNTGYPDFTLSYVLMGGGLAAELVGVFLPTATATKLP